MSKKVTVLSNGFKVEEDPIIVNKKNIAKSGQNQMDRIENKLDLLLSKMGVTL